MTKNKDNYLSIILIFLALAGIIALGFLFLRNNNNLSNLVNSNNEIDELKDINSDSLNSQEVFQKISAINETDHYLGNLDAPVQMIVYSDFDCPFCARFTETVEKVKTEFSEDEVVIAFRHYSLASHTNALETALASECAAEQGAFWKMYERLYEDYQIGSMTSSEYNKDAAELNLDLAVFDQCLSQEKYKDKIQTQMIEAKNFGVSGTPTIFINQEILPGAYPFEDFLGADGNEEGVESVIKKYLNN